MFFAGFVDGTTTWYSPDNLSNGDYYYLYSGGSSSKMLSSFYPAIYLPTDINLTDYSYVYYSYVVSTVGSISYSFSTSDTTIYFDSGRSPVYIPNLIKQGGQYSCTFNSDNTIATINFAIPVVDQNGQIPNWKCAYNILYLEEPISTGMQYVSVNNLVLSTDPFDLNIFNQLKEISQNTSQIIEQEKANGATLEHIEQAVGQTNQKLDDINKTLTESDLDKTFVTDFNNSLDEYQNAEVEIADIGRDILQTPVEVNGQNYVINSDHIMDNFNQIYSSSLDNFDLFSIKSSRYFRGTLSSFISIFGIFVFFPLVLGLLGSLLGRYRE